MNEVVRPEWLGSVSRGHLGESLWTKRPVVEELMRRLPVSLKLGSLALLFSVIFRSAATAVFMSIGVWLLVTFLWPLFSPQLANALTGASDILGVLETQQTFARLSPVVMYNEIVAIVLDPSIRSTQQSMLAKMGLMLIERGAIPDAPIPLLQSVLIVWPQIVGLVAGSILLFVAGYVVFQRQEVRA